MYCDDTHYLSPNCTAQCNEGYIGEASFECLYTTAWLGSLTCTRSSFMFTWFYINALQRSTAASTSPASRPTPCTTALVYRLILATCAELAADTVYTGQPCGVSCAFGWVGTSVTYVCGADASWHSADPPINCQRLAGVLRIGNINLCRQRVPEALCGVQRDAQLHR